MGTNRLNRLLQRAAPFLLLAIVALGGELRFYQIGSKGLWLDEAFSVWLGWQSLGEMLSWLVRIDQHPPLYYALLHLWMVLGGGAATLRVLSAPLGTLTIPVVYLPGGRLSDEGEKVGPLVALILAVSPSHVRFAQETRMYMLLMFNASLALCSLVRLLTDPRSARVRPGQQFVDFWRAQRAARGRGISPCATLIRQGQRGNRAGWPNEA